MMLHRQVVVPPSASQTQNSERYVHKVPGTLQASPERGLASGHWPPPSPGLPPPSRFAQSSSPHVPASDPGAPPLPPVPAKPPLPPVVPPLPPISPPAP